MVVDVVVVVVVVVFALLVELVLPLVAFVEVEEVAETVPLADDGAVVVDTSASRVVVPVDEEVSLELSVAEASLPCGSPTVGNDRGHNATPSASANAQKAARSPCHQRLCRRGACHACFSSNEDMQVWQKRALSSIVALHTGQLFILYYPSVSNSYSYNKQLTSATVRCLQMPYITTLSTGRLTYNSV